MLLVEASMFTKGDLTVVVPTLFGYTPEARRAKVRGEVSGASSAVPRHQWDEVLFFEAAESVLEPAQVRAVRQLYDWAQSQSFSITFGTGKNGSFNLKHLAISTRAIVTVNIDGALWLNLGWLEGSPLTEKVREELRTSFAALFETFPANKHFCRLPVEVWGRRVEPVVAALSKVLEE